MGTSVTKEVTGEDLRDKPSLPPNTLVGHYEVLRFLGDGGMASVYLARDQTLGRRVALKLLHKNAGQDVVLEEARMLAQFNQPNIITVYGVGEHEGEAYIAMEYVEGETLRARAETEPLSLREAQRVALAVAQGLEEAHRRNIVHGDLKPENVMIGRDGRARILDFGLAKSFEAPLMSDRQSPSAVGRVSFEATSDRRAQTTQRVSYEDHPLPAEQQQLTQRTDIKGTPTYMAPEQWEGVVRTPAIDIWAFGVMLFELLTGERPYDLRDVFDIRAVTSAEPLPSIAPRRELPEALSDLVDRCLSKIPGRRPNATELVRTLFALVHGGESSHNEVESPFRGLSAFTEEHANFFFGRDEDIGLFIERLRHEVVLPIIGASGVGKSSFIQAGVIPRLREKGEWRVVRMRPGADPFRTLASRFHRTGSGSQPEAETTTGEPLRKSEVSNLAQQLFDNPKLLALWLQRQAKTEHGKILLLVDQLEEVCTLVSDIEVRNRFLAAVCNAADDPADPVRVVFTARDDFLSRLAESSDARLALQRVAVLRAPGEDALREILVRPLQAVGYSYDDPALVDEVVKAVANESAALPLVQFMGSMLWDRRDRGRQVLLRTAYEAIGGVQGALATHADEVMTSLGEAQTRLVRTVMLRLVTPEGTRRVTAKTAITEALGAEAEDILVRLSQARLLAVRDVFGETHYELSHESLVHTWDRLSVWLEEGRDEIVFLSELEQASQLWDRRGRSRSEVWTAKALDDALRSIDRYRCKLPELAAAFVIASKAAERRRQLLKRVAVSVGAFALVAIAVVSVITAISFAEKTRIAEQQRAQALAEGARSSFLRGDFVAAWAQLRSSIEISDSSLVRALFGQMRAQPVVWRKQLPSLLYDLSVSPDGRTFAASALDKSVYLVDSATSELRSLRDGKDQMVGVAFAPDGKHLAGVDLGGTVYLWDLATQKVEHRAVHKSTAWKVAFHPSGEIFVSTSWDGTVVVQNLQFEELVRLSHPAPAVRAAFSPDGKELLVGAGQGELFRYRTQSWELIDKKTLSVRAPVFALSSDGEGGWLAGLENGHIVQLREDGKESLINAHAAGVTGLSVRDGVIVSVGYDAKIRAHRLDSGERTDEWLLHDSGLTAVGMTSDGFVSAGQSDRTIELVRLEKTVPPRPPLGHTGESWSVIGTRDGLRLYSAGDHGTVIEWDAASGEQLRRWTLGNEAICGLQLSSNEKRLVVSSDDKLIRVLDLPAGEVIATLVGHENAVNGAWLVADDTKVVSVSMDATARLWDLKQQKLIKTQKLPSGAMSGHLNGQRLAISSLDAPVEVLSVPDLQRLWVGPVGRGVALSPDGSSLAVASTDGHVRLIDSKQVTKLDVQPSVRPATPGDFSSDGKRIGFGHHDGAFVTDIASGASVRLSAFGGAVMSFAFFGQGRAAFVSDDANVRAFDAEGRSLWFLQGVHRSRRLVVTHRGVETFEGKAVLASDPAAADLPKAMFDERSGVLCSLSEQGELHLESDRRSASSANRLVRPLLVRATDRGCWALHEPGAVFFDGQTTTELADVRGLSVDNGESRLLEKNRAGGGRSPSDLNFVPVGANPSAITKINERWLVGYQNGALEWASERGSEVLSLQDLPTSAPILFERGPLDSLFVAFANGSFGVWSMGSGARLALAKAHGPVVDIERMGETWVAFSDLGSRAELSLSMFASDWCRVRESISRVVPLRWVEGRPLLSQSPGSGTGDVDCLAP